VIKRLKIKNIKTMAIYTAFGLLLAGASMADAAALIKVDGSSTVFPITEAVSEEFQKAEKGATHVTVGMSGTGGGFKKFCAGEIDVSDASRPIKPTEIELCNKNGVEYVEIPVAFDGIVVAVNPKNDWASQITVAELKKLWEPEAQGKVTKWSQVRAGWPDKEIHLFGAGVDSGTYDYFTEAIVGKEHSSRGDFTSSEDDNVLVQGISTDQKALGFFGLAYYENNKDRLKAVTIGAVAPDYDNVVTGAYQPLSRPLFIYVSKKSAAKPEVKRFIDFYIKNGAALSKEVGYVALPAKAYELAQAKFNSLKTGTVFGGQGSKVGVKIEELLK
jgi:phosphate transport system substrate-binding protein